MTVSYMSFSAHADAKGIMQLVRQCQPRNIVFVHGEASKMQALSKKIFQESGEALVGACVCVEMFEWNLCVVGEDCVCACM